MLRIFYFLGGFFSYDESELRSNLKGYLFLVYTSFFNIFYSSSILWKRVLSSRLLSTFYGLIFSLFLAFLYLFDFGPSSSSSILFYFLESILSSPFPSTFSSTLVEIRCVYYSLAVLSDSAIASFIN